MCTIVILSTHYSFILLPILYLSRSRFYLQRDILFLLQCSLTHIFSVSIIYGTVRIFNNSKEKSTINSVLCGCADFGCPSNTCRCILSLCMYRMVLFLEHHNSPSLLLMYVLNFKYGMSIQAFFVRLTTKTNLFSSETTQPDPYTIQYQGYHYIINTYLILCVVHHPDTILSFIIRKKVEYYC